MRGLTGREERRDWGRWCFRGGRNEGFGLGGGRRMEIAGDRGLRGWFCLCLCLCLLFPSDPYCVGNVRACVRALYAFDRPRSFSSSPSHSFRLKLGSYFL